MTSGTKNNTYIFGSRKPGAQIPTVSKDRIEQARRIAAETKPQKKDS